MTTSVTVNLNHIFIAHLDLGWCAIILAIVVNLVCLTSVKHFTHGQACRSFKGFSFNQQLNTLIILKQAKKSTDCRTRKINFLAQLLRWFQLKTRFPL